MPTDEPTPPQCLPKYLAEGVPKQDTETLDTLNEWIDEILEYRRQTVDEEDLPENVEPIEEGGRGTIAEETVKCGDESCSCMSGGGEHGPYKYRYFYKDGELTSEYVGKVGE
jgi:hypothetical protein